MMTTEALQGNISRMLTDEAVYVTYVFLYVREVIFRDYRPGRQGRLEAFTRRTFYDFHAGPACGPSSS